MNEAWRTSNPWALDVALKRDARITARPPTNGPGKMTQLLTWTTTKLQPVAAPGVYAPDLVKMTGPSGAERVLICGRRDGPSFCRSDGLQCHFKIVVREAAVGLIPLSYVMHVEAPADGACPRFLRWELQAERKPGVDAVKEPIAHLHPGHDAVRVPTPVFTPRELVTLFLGLERWW